MPADVPKTGPNTKPGEKPPVMPLEATQHTARGAKAFAEFFIKTIDWGYATTSSAYMRHYSTGGCQGCEIFVRGLDKARRAHDHFVGGRMKVVGASLLSRSTTKRPIAEVSFNISSIEEVDSSGHFVKADGAHSDERFHVTLAWRTDRWSVVDLAVAV